MLSVSNYIASDGRLMNLKGFRKKQLWFHWGSILAFAWRGWGEPWKPQSGEIMSQTRFKLSTSWLICSMPLYVNQSHKLQSITMETSNHMTLCLSRMWMELGCWYSHYWTSPLLSPVLAAPHLDLLWIRSKHNLFQMTLHYRTEPSEYICSHQNKSKSLYS
jgi:hypothetical protein